MSEKSEEIDLKSYKERLDELSSSILNHRHFNLSSEEMAVKNSIYGKFPSDFKENKLLKDDIGSERYEEELSQMVSFVKTNETITDDNAWIYFYANSLLAFNITGDNSSNPEDYSIVEEKLKNIIENEDLSDDKRIHASLILGNNLYQNPNFTGSENAFEYYETAFELDKDEQVINGSMLSNEIVPKMATLLTRPISNGDQARGKYAQIADSYNSGKNIHTFVEGLNKAPNISSETWCSSMKEIVSASFNGNRTYESNNFKLDVNSRLEEGNITAVDYLTLYTDVLKIEDKNSYRKYLLGTEYAQSISNQIVNKKVDISNYNSKLLELNDYLIQNPDAKGIKLYEIFDENIRVFSEAKKSNKLSEEENNRIATETHKTLLLVKSSNPKAFTAYHGDSDVGFLKLYKRGYSENFFNLENYTDAIQSFEKGISDDTINEVYGDKNEFFSNIFEKEVGEENVGNYVRLIGAFVNKTSTSAEEAVVAIQKSISDSKKDSISTEEVVAKARIIRGLVEETKNNEDKKDVLTSEESENVILMMLDEGVKNGKITTDQKAEALKKLKEEKTISEETYKTEMKKMINSGELGIPQQTSSVEETLKLDKIKLTAKDADGKNWYEKIIGYKFGKREGDIIDVISDYGWSVNTFKSGSGSNGINKENNIPFCYAIEYQQLYNASISNIIQSLVGLVSSAQHAVEGTVDAISGIFGKLTGFLTTIAVRTFQSDSAVNGTPLDAESVGNDASKMMEDIGDRIKGGVNNVGESLNGIIARFTRTGQSPVATGSGLLAPYLLMYCVKPTNRKYCFPMLDKSSSYFKAVNKMEEKDGGMGSSILGNKLFSTIANVGRTMMGIAEDIEQIAPFLADKSVASGGTRQYHIERSKYFSYPSDGEEIETSFVLYNTVKQNIWKDHYKFIMGFMLRNLPFKYDVVAYYPPLFYDVHVPGVKRCPFCYVDNFDVSPLGLTRTLKISGKDFGIGADKTLYSVNVPEAWMVKVKFKSLLATSSNQILSGFIDTPITSNVNDGSPENKTTQPNA